MLNFGLLLRLSISLLILSTILIGPINGAKKDEKKGDSKLGTAKPADDKVKDLVERLEPDIREKICALTTQLCLEGNYPIEAQLYKKQVVTGTNYFVAVSMQDRWFHARIFEQTWTETLELVDLIGPKGKKEEIKYF